MIRDRAGRKLAGREGWRIRLGQYRVIYEIEEIVRVVRGIESSDDLAGASGRPARETGVDAPALLSKPEATEVQSDGRIRHWRYVGELGKHLRVITLADGETLHNAFPDRPFKPKES